MKTHKRWEITTGLRHVACIAPVWLYVFTLDRWRAVIYTSVVHLHTYYTVSPGTFWRRSP